MKYEPLENLGVFIHAVDLEITGYVNKQLSEFQLTSEQNLVMAILWEREGISQNEIAAKLGKDKSSITRMLSTLERNGYIRRETCLIDRRAVEIFLTETGRKLGEDVIPINKQIVQAVKNGLTSEEIVELQRLLTKVRENVSES